ncbi:methyl-accepting chemotaxis protein [Desulfobacterales bacterium HSG2]|nr:methyl-accepting chemotaxis protein [Desulfobacterales bacterium HSG2]
MGEGKEGFLREGAVRGSLWRNSIQFRVSAVLIIQTTIIMAGFAVFNYFETVSKMNSELNNLAEVTAKRLSENLIISVWGLDKEVAERTIISEMTEKQIYAIFVRDGNGRIFLGKKRDDNWEVMVSSVETEIDISEIKKHHLNIVKHEDIVKEGASLGVLEIYFTSEFMRRRLSRFVISTVFLTMLINIALFVTLFVTIKRSMINPIRELSEKIVQAANGDMTVSTASDKRSDEIGMLARAFLFMLNTLRDQIQQIMEGASTIASSITQISSIASQLAGSSSQTSASVTEISVTVEEVRQTAYISNEKAIYVSNISEHAAHTSEKGKKATENTVSGMSRIKMEMEYVAESVVKLSEQAQSIMDIISAVNDLAEQSNLLSVNASIEAAKAGEHGKGFAVVAQEVKSLADQSKAATKQVKTILNDIQKAISAAVLATERGSKAVEAGVSLSGEAGDSIDMLAESVEQSVQAIIQIAASSQEQLVGMDQLVEAMQNIKGASVQNADSAGHLETATENLEQLGQNLRRAALMFKV